MADLDRDLLENILIKLDREKHLFPQFKLSYDDGKLRMLGKGSFSCVYEMANAEHPENLYALKVLGVGPRTVSSEEFKNTTRLQWILCQETEYVVRILDERELFIRLSDDGNVAEVREKHKEAWDEEESGLYLQFILMEKLEKVILKDAHNNVSPFDWKLRTEPEIVKFAMEVGQAINKAHSMNALHRDIKLENIFWDPAREVYKLGDFGMAKFTDDGNAATVIYTDGYGAPEIERRFYDHYNATADIYSFGITLYLLFNNFKFPGSDGYHPNFHIQYDPQFVFPAPINAPEGMSRVIRRMCSYYPEDRYQTMGDVLDAIAEVESKAVKAMPEDLMEEILQTTETYREKAEGEDGQSGETPDGEDLSGAWDSDVSDRKMTRAERIERQIFEKRLKNELHAVLIAFITLITLLTVSGMQSFPEPGVDVLFLALPVALLLESVFQHFRDFHLFFGIITAFLICMSAMYQGITFVHILLLLCVIMGCPGLSVAGGAATLMWIVYEMIRDSHTPGFLLRYDLGWIFMAVLIIVYFYYFVIVRCTDKLDGLLWLHSIVLPVIFSAMIAAGVILTVQQKNGNLVIPDLIMRMHLIRSGVLGMMPRVIRHFPLTRRAG